MLHTHKFLAITLSTLALTACDLDTIDIDESVETSDPVTTDPEPGTALLKQQIYENDDDNDGFIDRTASISYDRNGNAISESIDDDNDGIPDRISNYRYDSNSNLLRFTTETADGIVLWVYDFTYNENGNRISLSQDGGLFTGIADGTPDFITNYTYDTYGNLLSESFDLGNDNSIDSLTTYVYDYDANGNILTSYESSGFSDGTINSVTSYTYDVNGNRLSETIDNDNDGSTDSINTYTLDASGNQLSESRDNDADGTIDTIITSTYDADGNRLSLSYDDDADGTTDSNYTYTYDANGNLLSESYDSDGDGIFDRVDTPINIYY